MAPCLFRKSYPYVLVIVCHQQMRDRLRDFAKAGFVAHRSSRKSEDQTEIRAVFGSGGLLLLSVSYHRNRGGHRC